MTTCDDVIAAAADYAKVAGQYRELSNQMTDLEETLSGMAQEVLNLLEQKHQARDRLLRAGESL